MKEFITTIRKEYLTTIRADNFSPADYKEWILKELRRVDIELGKEMDRKYWGSTPYKESKSWTNCKNRILEHLEDVKKELSKDTAGVLPKNKASEPLPSGEELVCRSPSSGCDNAKISKDAYDRMCDTIYKTEQEDLLVGRVAGMLRDFMRECNDSKRWDARTSRAEVGGFMRAWARKIIEEVQS